MYLLVLPDLGVVRVDSGDGASEDLSIEGGGVGSCVHQWSGALDCLHVVTGSFHHVPQVQPLAELTTGFEPQQ